MSYLLGVLTGVSVCILFETIMYFIARSKEEKEKKTPQSYTNLISRKTFTHKK